MVEFWDVYNKKGKKKNKTVKKGQPLLSGEYHLIVEGWIKTSSGSFLLQKRSEKKRIFANMWYSSFGGSVLAGEEPKAGLIREAYEELGIDISSDVIRLKRIISENHCIFYIYLIERDIDLTEISLQEDEVLEVRIFSVEEMKALISKGEMIELDYYKKFFNL